MLPIVATSGRRSLLRSPTARSDAGPPRYVAPASCWPALARKYSPVRPVCVPRTPTRTTPGFSPRRSAIDVAASTFVSTSIVCWVVNVPSPLPRLSTTSDDALSAEPVRITETASRSSSPFTSATTVASWKPPPVPESTGAPNPPLALRGSTESEANVLDTMSRRPSPVTSPTPRPSTAAPLPLLRFTAAPKVPSPWPGRTNTLFGAKDPATTSIVAVVGHVRELHREDLAAAGERLGRSRERPVRPLQVDVDPPEDRGDQVGATVVVDVAGPGDVAQRAADRRGVRDRRPEAPLPEVERAREVRAVVPDRDQVEAAVPVEVAGGQAGAAGGVRTALGEAAVSLALEQGGDPGR